MSASIQRSFTGGEIAPALYARADQVKYATGARTIRNNIVMRHGGTQNRPGTQFIGEVKDSDFNVRLIPFVFNNDQTYICEFGRLYIRFIQNGSYIKEAGQAITGITQANPATVSLTGHGYSNGDEIVLSGIVGMTELNGRNVKVTNVFLNQFDITFLDGTNVDSTGFGAYVSGGTAAKIYELAAPYFENQLKDIRFTQSADVMYLTHPGHFVRTLNRLTATTFSLVIESLAPAISAPTGIVNISGPAGADTHQYVVTAVAEDSFEESLPSTASPVFNYGPPTASTPIVIQWTATSGAVEYNVYKNVNGVYGLVGVAGQAGTPQFEDIGVAPDTGSTPPQTGNQGFAAPNNTTPKAVAFYQQRLVFGGSTSEPEKISMSQINRFTNFLVHRPSLDDDAVFFTAAGQKVNEINHLLDLRKLIIFTQGNELTVEGDDAGIVTPTSINVRQQTYNGSNFLRPIIVDGSALYVQARGTIIRDIGYNVEADGYRGNDLTIFSAHLFDDYTLADWDYQQVPHSIVWAARSDGTLLGVTYVKNQQILAWHRHDFQGGVVENVASVPEGTTDAVYLVIKRTIDGREVRYVERFSDRNIIDLIDNKFMDSHLTYDGRNTSGTTMTVSGGTTWEATETLTMTASAGTFVATDIGNEIHLTDANDDMVRYEITAYTSSTVVSVKGHKTTPVAMRNTALTSWSRAVNQVSGLWHLEGEDVSVFADEFVAASPNNDSYTTVTVSNGAITLDKPYAVIHVGLPYISDLETLDLETTQSETLSDKNKQIVKLNLFVEETRGLWVGPKPPSNDATDPLEGLVEMKLRSDEDYDEPVGLKTRVISANINSEFNRSGRVFIRQVDPVPSSILAVTPIGYIPVRG